jgi:hypothetical protein
MFSNNTSVAIIIIADFTENVKGLSKKILVEKRNGCKFCTLPTNTAYSLHTMKIDILPSELQKQIIFNGFSVLLFSWLL